MTMDQRAFLRIMSNTHLRASSGRFALILLLLTVSFVADAQEADIDALTAEIDSRSGQYGKLIEILQGPDGNRALAAFDVMVESGHPTMIEVAVNAGLASTDSRLRARALWEAVSRKDAITIQVERNDLSQEEAAALESWDGPVQTFPLFQRFSETQCVNLTSNATCIAGFNVSISGIKLDLAFTRGGGGGVNGSFLLDETGTLVGDVMDRKTKATYPARIVFR